MAAGKINELVSDEAIAKLEQLYKTLGITKDMMVSATEQAVKFSNALSGSKSIQDFQQAQEKAATATQSVISANE